MLSLLSAAVILMLLLGCANVGNLQLARGLSRGGELAVRRALGAPRGRLIRQPLLESMCLCTVAAGSSLVLAAFVVPMVIQRVWPAQAPVAGVGWRAVLFASGLAVGTCVIAGVLPALSAARMTGSARYARGAAPHLRTALLGFQVAASFVLLAGAGLLVRGIHHAAGPGLGFNLSGAVAVRINPPATYTPADREQLLRGVIEASERMGLPRVAASNTAPYTGGSHATLVQLPQEESVVGGLITRHYVSPAYFDVLEIPLIAGRLFDDGSAPEEVVVNESLARLLWPPDRAIGGVFLDTMPATRSTPAEPAAARPPPEVRRVIGVVGDARTDFFNVRQPMYYTSRPGAFQFMLVRDEPGAAARLRDLIQAVEPAASPEIRPLGAEMWEQLSPAIRVAVSGAAVSLLALLLAAVGTFGVFTYVVNERTREIGVRMVLGARARDVVRMLVARLSRPLAGGLVAGVLGAQALGGVLGSRLYGLSPRDPITYLLMLLVLMTAAVAAIWIPARRALRVDPAVTLRAE